MASFHELEVSALDRITDESVAVTFAVPPAPGTTRSVPVST